LNFGQKLTWTPHIRILKAKCTQAIGIINYLSHPSKGCNRKISLQLCKSLIRSRLDYGAPIYDYNTASKSTLKLLDPIQLHALRLALGAFRTSPGLSLCAEAADHYRSLILKRWNTFWNNQHPNKLLAITKTPCPWTVSDRQSRREEIILTRLRIGHTRIIHSFIISPNTLFPLRLPLLSRRKPHSRVHLLSPSSATPPFYDTSTKK